MSQHSKSTLSHKVLFNTYTILFQTSALQHLQAHISTGTSWFTYK